MAGVILFDMAATFAGQPASYWSDPATVHEGNRLFHWVMSRGYPVAMLVDAVYLAGSVLLVSILPWRLGLTLLFALVLGHYFGGSTWLCFRYGLGAQGMVLYGLLLAAVLVGIGFRPATKSPRE